MSHSPSPDSPSDAPNRRHILSRLFLSTLYLSAFTFGGGYVIVSLLKTKFVDELHWIDQEEMLDLVAIAQSSPGPIAVNGAIVIGYKLAGLLGIFFAVLGAIIPPVIILTLISLFYNFFQESFVFHALLTGMKAGVSAVIISVVYDMAAAILKSRDVMLTLIMLLAFLANYIFKINVVIIILFTVFIGAIATILREKGKKNSSEGGKSL